MTSLPGYALGVVVHESADRLVIRGRRDRDGASVVAKLFKQEYPRQRDLARLKHEFEVLQSLGQPSELPGIVRPYALERHGNGLALILEAVEGEPLSQYIHEGATDLRTTLKIACAVAEILSEIHERGAIHKDVKPRNILFDRQTGRVVLIDFGIASRLSQELQQALAPDALEGTLAYMSPEQTGRMNRAIDHRTDLYSFGVTLYEMLTGVLPFVGTEPMELVHQHLAKVPTAPHVLVPTIPEQLSRLVLKLIAKAAEDRYQSARGLLFDLRQCLQAWEERGAIAPFPLGARDISAVLQVSQKLYGRDAPVAALVAAYERVRRGKSELVLLQGAAGSGKTAVISGFQQALVQRDGALVVGRFERFARTLPFAAFTQAFRELVRRLLTQSAAKLAEWKSRLLGNLGGNARLLTDLVPDLELIIGPQPPLGAVGPTEAQNRFGHTVLGFVRAFCSAAQPLVLVVDDIQWADPASLWLFRRLLMDHEQGCFLLVAAYRDSEVDTAHPLHAALQEVRQHGLVPTELLLEPLTREDILRLLADSLRLYDSQRLDGLARQVHDKTRGNPFFVIEFLRRLQQAKLLWLDAAAGAWTWDESGIAAAPITDNVGELMAGQLQRLSAETQHLLGVAACLGSQFELSALSALTGASPADTSFALGPAINESLVLPLSRSERAGTALPAAPSAESGEGEEGVSFRFLHDRVQQAAYSLLLESERQEQHLRIGRYLQKKLCQKPRAEALFATVHHLNSAGERIHGALNAHELACLNQQAGRLAAAAADYPAAVEFLLAGVARMGDAGWQQDAALMHSLGRDLSEYEYLAGRFEQANSRLEGLLQHAQTDRQRAELLGLRMRLLTSQGRFLEGVMAGQAGLELCGIALPKTPQEGEAMFFGEIAGIDAILKDREIASFIDAPALEDPDQIAVLRLMVDLAQPAYQVAPPLGALLLAQQAHFSLRHGQSPLALYGYVAYGLIMAGLLGRYAQAIEMGRLARKLVERFNAKEMACKVGLMFGLYSPYGEPMRDSLAMFFQAQQDGMESGDHVYGSLAYSYVPLTQLRLGEPLTTVHASVERGLAAMKRTRDGINVELLGLVRQVALCLEGQTSAPTSLNGAGFEESAWLARAEAMGFNGGRCLFHGYKLQLAYLHEDWSQALAMAAEAERTLASALGMHWTSDILFYSCLALAAAQPAPSGTAPVVPEALTRNANTLAALAQACPVNEQHRHLLVRAEIARLSAEYGQAIELYEEAIAKARDNGFPHHEALAKEIYARFHLLRGHTTIAKIYLTEARYGYETWGAVAKVAQLDQKYDELLGDMTLAKLSRSRGGDISDTTTTVSLSGQQLDVASVLKTAQAISSEIILEKVLDRMMHILVANAGAQRGFLVLEREGELWVKASVEVNPDRVEVSLHERVSERRDLAQSIVNYVARSRHTIVLPNASGDPRFALDPYIVSARPKSVLCLALLHQGRLVGILYLENNVTGGAFTHQRVELLRLLSAQAAISVENAQLYSNLQEATNKLRQVNETLEQQVAQRTADLSRALADLWTEMDLASKIQTVLLPTNIHIPGYDVSAILQPAANVGGDYYDVFHAAGTDWLLIGDVSGHGITAGLCMMMVQTAVRSVVRTLQRHPEALRPAEVLAFVNSAIHQNLSQIGKDQYMTISAMCFREGQISYSGQHQDILIYRAAHKRVDRIETTGVWLGVLPTIDGMLREDVLTLEPGDMLLLFTDGVTEARIGKRKFLYTAGLVSLFQEIAVNNPTPDQIISFIRERLKEYFINDDMTLIALKRHLSGSSDV